MSVKCRRGLIICIVFFALFLAFTVVVKTVDVQAIGPQDSSVGLATVNRFMAARTSGSELFKTISDVAGYLSLAIVFGWGVYGLVQWIRRKDIREVDTDLITAGGVFVLTGLFYALFEFVVINYRPVLEDGKLAASYPSSHTVLVLVVMLISVMLLEQRIKSKVVFHILSFLMDAVAVLTVLFREQSGIHWFTDIVGGMILSGALVMLFQFLSDLWKEKKSPACVADESEEPDSAEETDAPEDAGEETATESLGGTDDEPAEEEAKEETGDLPREEETPEAADGDGDEEKKAEEENG